MVRIGGEQVDPTAKIALIRRLANEIYSRLAAAPADALNVPSACSEWDVGTVVAHLTGGAMRQRDSMLRGRDGHSGPPEGSVESTTPDQVQQRNALSNRQFRESLGDYLLERFRDVYTSLDEVLQAWTDWTIGCWHHRRGTMPASSYLDLRIQELVIHDWDMRSQGVGAAALDAEGAVALLPESQMWHELCFRPTAPLPQPIVYRFDVGNGAPGASLQHDIVVSGDHFSVEASNGRVADVVISCGVETYLLCLYGRADWVSAAQAGRLFVAFHSDDRLDPDKQNMFDHNYLQRFHEWFGGL